MSPLEAAARPIQPAAPDAPDAMPLSGLNGQLMAALTALAGAGEADLACRIAARAWALVRHTAPEEARALEKLLHRLTRPISHAHPKIPKGKS